MTRLVMEDNDGFPVDKEPTVEEAPAVDPMASPVDEVATSVVADGSLAGRLRALGEKMRAERTEDFPIPLPPEVADVLDGGSIVVRARVIRDRRTTNTRRPEEVFIIRATRALLLVDADRTEHELPGWTHQTAALLGQRFERATDLVSFLFDGGNRAMLNEFVGELYEWMAGRAEERDGAAVELEDALGE